MRISIRRRLLRRSRDIAKIAEGLGLTGVSEQATKCERSIEGGSGSDVYRALDDLAAVEAALLSIPLHDELSSLVDDPIEGPLNDLVERRMPIVDGAPHFEIDSETLEIFRTEGDELLASISLGLDILAASPADQNALWDIRRAAHTFKGAAGIVGLSEAGALAHKMEDLLDRLVETSAPASVDVLDFLRGSVRSLNSILDDAPANAAGLELAYSSAIASLNGRTADAPVPSSSITTERPPVHKPTVRISLDKLGDIVRLAEELLVDHPSLDRDSRRLAMDIHDRLVRIRMVRFGTLETRLERAAGVTARDEGKKVLLEIETPDVEIDTLLVDALVEPLLHLIKNAVVHGIESPDVRRMIGKHEFGLVTIGVEADDEAVVVTVSDDGAGIVVTDLKERAVERRLISPRDAGSMSDRDAYKLLFERGLTTTETVTLNAGRGVGMGIVKESI